MTLSFDTVNSKNQISDITAENKELEEENQKLKAEMQQLNLTLAEYQLGWPPGHFYSPIPSLKEIKAKEDLIFKSMPNDMPGIHLQVENQLKLLKEFEALYDQLPFTPKKQRNFRYFFENSNFSYGEGTILYSMMRYLQPKRIIEIGSGYSSCAILDINDLFFAGNISCTFIEPYADLLLSLVRESDLAKFSIVQEHAQSVNEKVFSQLEEGDILFIDSTHVSKIDSDVNHILFRILPALPRGVYIHFHDIYYPFEYPKEWIYQSRAWNEAYILRAFLQYNESFEIVFFNSFLNQLHSDTANQKKMPYFWKNSGSSLWLKKL